MRQPVDHRSQIALMLEQGVNGVGLFPSKTEQDGNLDVAVGAVNEFGGIVLVATIALVVRGPRKVAPRQVVHASRVSEA